LTTDESGLAVKGIKSGYMIGTALSSLVDGEQGEVMVALDIKPVTLTEGAQNNLVRVIKDGLEGIFLTPIEALRYVGAMIIVVAGAITAFVYFGRVAKSGVDAIGRNPLASQAIQRSVVLNVLLTMFIISVGVGVAYLILVI
jgi:F0F1-type ATP synthase membrane subunit c/vacuolar-type H+-ATPase subunit K